MNISKIIAAITQSTTILCLFIGLVITFVLAVVLLVLFIKLNSKYKRFMNGADGESLEKSIEKHLDDIESLKLYSEDVRKHLKRLDGKAEHSFQKYAFRKYDAYEGLGGHLSFSLCMLDEKEDGYILSSIHTREGCYTYIKEIIKGEGIVLLSDEEKNTLSEAKSEKE